MHDIQYYDKQLSVITYQYIYKKDKMNLLNVESIDGADRNDTGDIFKVQRFILLLLSFE